ncbi:DNA alkylation response protein, partial [Paraburkholderia sp. SIMBA_009]
EGSGNVMCIDVLRAVSREPDAAAALLAELTELGAGEPRIRAALDVLHAMLATPADALEASARLFAQRLALVAQACLLTR